MTGELEILVMSNMFSQPDFQKVANETDVVSKGAAYVSRS